jgi:excisionase family DNA binding protein
MNQLLTKKDVASVLRITVRGVDKMVIEKRIPYLKLGKMVRFNPTTLEKWMESRSIKQAR